MDYLLAIKKNPQYWCSNAEIFARTFEKCISIALSQQDIENHFLAKPLKHYQSKIYPPDALCHQVWPFFKTLFKAVLSK